MQKIKNIINKINIFQRLKCIEKNQAVIISAHNNLDRQFKLLLEHNGLTLVVGKKGKLFYRKNGRKKVMTREEYHRLAPPSASSNTVLTKR